MAVQPNFEIIVPLPKHYTAEMVAQAFTAYLMGENMFDRSQFDSKYLLQAPPFYIEIARKWQLDHGNNHWLHIIDDHTVRITSRYNSPRVVAKLEAAAALFRAANIDLFDMIVPLPENFTAEMAARTFATYLMSPNMLNSADSINLPPFYENGRWQLDENNNHSLYDKGDGTVLLCARYKGRKLEAMVAMFRAANSTTLT